MIIWLVSIRVTPTMLVLNKCTLYSYTQRKSSTHFRFLISVLTRNGCIYNVIYHCIQKSFCINCLNSKLKYNVPLQNVVHGGSVVEHQTPERSRVRTPLPLCSVLLYQDTLSSPKYWLIPRKQWLPLNCYEHD